MYSEKDLRLREYVEYNPATGILYWKKDKTPRGKKGAEVGSINSEGYRVFKLDGKAYAAHRVAVFLKTGKWPTGEVDHKNHTRHDNRWRNLRDCTQSVNQRNRKQADRDNQTGLLGVSQKGNRFRASLTRGGKHIHLGYFATSKAAYAAYIAARTERTV